MKKSLFEQLGGTYRQVGDYFIPNLALPNEQQKPIGIWGQRHRRYLKQNKRIQYMNLLTSGKLNSYLADIDQQAEEMFSRLVNDCAVKEGVSEQLKAKDMMRWVGLMNSIRNAATEIVNQELIFV